MRDMLNRGFTTIRDTGGADWGLQQAVETGLFVGPRMFVSGQSIGPTGGHNDSRRRTDPGGGCSCSNALAFTSAIADGADLYPGARGKGTCVHVPRRIAQRTRARPLWA